MRVALLLAAVLLAAPKKEAPPPLPAPEVRLRVEPRAEKTWRIEITNQGTTPLRIVADARLLRLTIDAPPSTTPLAKWQKPPAPTECVLPGAMRSDERTLTLPPGGKWTDEIDVRLLCLDRVDRLIDGAIVTPRFGWAAPKNGKLAPPFAVVPADSGVASAKEIAAAAIILDAVMYPKKTKSSSDPIVASAGASRSVGNGKEADLSIVLRNESAETRTIYARPQMVDGTVVDPRGQVIACRGPAMQPAPIADFATRLAPKGTWSATVPLKGLCPSGTFDRPGLYLVTPSIQLPAMPKEPKAVTGAVIAPAPQLLRVETGTKPFYDAPPVIAKSS